MVTMRANLMMFQLGLYHVGQCFQIHTVLTHGWTGIIRQNTSHFPFFKWKSPIVLFYTIIDDIFRSTRWSWTPFGAASRDRPMEKKKNPRQGFGTSLGEVSVPVMTSQKADWSSVLWGKGWTFLISGLHWPTETQRLENVNSEACSRFLELSWTATTHLLIL